MADREKLARCEDRFRRIWNAGIMGFVTNTSGILTDISPALCEYLGHTQNELIGAHYCVPLAKMRDRKAVRAQLERVLQGQASSRMECRVRRASGGSECFELSLTKANAVENGGPELIVLFRAISPQKRRNKKTDHWRWRDTLTGLYNRRHFWNTLERLQSRGNAEYCLLLLDINGLKLINDALGQRGGDRVLEEVADLLRATLHFPAARLNGGQFAAIVYNSSVDEIERECEILSAFCKQKRQGLQPVSISWGIVCNRGSERLNAQEMYELAESNMLYNKLLQKFSLHSQCVNPLREALRARNLETAWHMERMERMAYQLGQSLNLSRAELDRLALLAALHDIGKLVIPDQIINKPGRLTDQEWQIMKSHSKMGYRIASASMELAGIAGDILHHHERWDGNGYPAGLKGEQIPLSAQMLAVIDTYDAMTHNRVYQEAVGHRKAIAELRRCSGTQFSPLIVPHFLEIFDNYCVKIAL